MECLKGESAIFNRKKTNRHPNGDQATLDDHRYLPQIMFIESISWFGERWTVVRGINSQPTNACFNVLYLNFSPISNRFAEIWKGIDFPAAPTISELGGT